MLRFKRFLFERDVQLNVNKSILELTKTTIWKELFKAVEKLANQPDTGNARTVKSLTYKVLTTVPEMDGYLEAVYGKDLASSGTYNKDNVEYKEVLAKVKNYVTQSPKWSAESSGAWYHFVKKGTKSGSDKTEKWYGTLKKRDTQSIKIILDMIYAISKIKTDVEIQLKVPGSYGAFLQHTDSAVIHFHDPALKNEIADIVSKFSSHFMNRGKFGRTDFGTDDKSYKDGSDSMIVAHKFTKTVEANIEHFKEYFKSKSEDDVNKIILSVINKIMQTAKHRQ